MEYTKKENLKNLFERDGNFLARTCEEVNNITNFLEFDFYQDMEDFDNTMNCLTPTEIAFEIEKAPEFYIHDDYFSFNGKKYEGLKSFSNLYDFYTQFTDELCDEIIEDFEELRENLNHYITDIVLQK